MKYCSECGTKLDDKAKFCVRCGTEQKNFSEDNDGEIAPAGSGKGVKKPGRNKVIIIAAVIAALVAAGVLIFVFMSLDDRTGDEPENNKAQVTEKQEEKVQKEHKKQEVETGPSADDIRNAYMDVIEGVAASVEEDVYIGYETADIDGDGIKELFVNKVPCAAEAVREIYTYRNGDARYIDTIPAGHSRIGVHKIEGVYSVYTQMGYTVVELIEYKNGRISLKLQYETPDEKSTGNYEDVLKDMQITLVEPGVPGDYSKL